VGWATTARGAEGFMWTDGRMVGLGDLPGGFRHSPGTPTTPSTLFLVTEWYPGLARA
jgi:probable HAF family extracellular repeat protein